MDMAKYRVVFLEESTEHLAEMSSALLALEKDLANGDAIDLIFRMAHSIKGMAASLDYDSITEVAHGLEDRMQEIRKAGRIADSEELAVLFHGLESLESMVAAIGETGEAAPANAEPAAAVSNRLQPLPHPVAVTPRAKVPAAEGGSKKKDLSATL